MSRLSRDLLQRMRSFYRYVFRELYKGGCMKILIEILIGVSSSALFALMALIFKQPLKRFVFKLLRLDLDERSYMS